MSSSPAGVVLLTRDPGEGAVVRELLSKTGLQLELRIAANRDGLLNALSDDSVVALLIRDGHTELAAADVVKLVRQRHPLLSIMALAGPGEADAMPTALAAAGVDDYVSPECGWRFVSSLRRALKAASLLQEQRRARWRDRATARLMAAVQELSLARDIETVQAIVRRAARDLTGAHGATFVLRDADRCYYVDEDAIGPLWKGQRFPMNVCVSGWVMSQRKPVVIEDVFADPRVPVEAYRPTFVKSMLMVPIRTESPIGAIGNYWAEFRRASADEVEILQALANTTAIAIENVRVYDELEHRVRERTRLLEETNRELEAFSYSVSHDLRSPLSAILGYADLLKEVLGEKADAEAVAACERIVQQTHRMSGLITDLLRLARISGSELNVQRVNLSAIAREVLDRLTDQNPHRVVLTWVEESLAAHADQELITIVVENLISNAWKYTGKVREAHIEIGSEPDAEHGTAYFVRDNGAGFSQSQASRLFSPFQRLHHQSDFPGVGVGLATVQRIIHKHGGRVWARGAVGQGATFYFTLPSRLAVELSKSAAQPRGETLMAKSSEAVAAR
jgi:K+-sensing histidine kinase KdpD